MLKGLLNFLGIVQKELKPEYDRPREKCPFYGFYQAPGALLDQKGNQCALITDSYSPCQMSTSGVDWNTCPFNNLESEAIIQKMMNTHRATPEEFWPKGKSSWSGMSLKTWYGYVMKKEKTPN